MGVSVFGLRELGCGDWYFVGWFNSFCFDGFLFCMMYYMVIRLLVFAD